MAQIQSFPEPEFEKPKRPLRPLHGIPDPERRGRAGWVVSGLLHGLIILALLLPPLVGKILEEQAPGGAGGAGPAGGGGGGTGGTGGAITPERIRYLQVQTPVGTPTPTPPPPVKAPTPTPVPTPPPEPVPEPQAAQPQVTAPPPPSGTTVPTAGTGGGSGRDGSAGNGSGTGGGVGSGTGTGRGAGVGSGTGGGNDQIFPPRVTNLAMLPLPVPSGVRPYRLVAQFEVDERGNARLIGFNPSRNRGYNAKLREMLSELRFNPATRADGTPVRDTAQVTFEAP